MDETVSFSEWACYTYCYKIEINVVPNQSPTHNVQERKNNNLRSQIQENVSNQYP